MFADVFAARDPRARRRAHRATLGHSRRERCVGQAMDRCPTRPMRFFRSPMADLGRGARGRGGSGPESGHTRWTCRRLPLGERCRCVGTVRDVGTLFARALSTSRRKMLYCAQRDTMMAREPDIRSHPMDAAVRPDTGTETSRSVRHLRHRGAGHGGSRTETHDRIDALCST